MKARFLLALLFALPALVSAYLAWLLWRDGDSGKWLFTVFAILFGLISAAPWLPRRTPAPESTSTRFVPHWFMMLAVLIVAGVVLAAVVSAVWRRL